MKRINVTTWVLISLFMALSMMSCAKDYTQNKEEVVFEVYSGDTVTSIAGRLKSEGVIGDTTRFRILSKLLRKDTSMKIGVYVIETNMSFNDLIDRLSSGVSYSVKVTIPEGYNMFEIAGVMEDSGLCTSNQFLSECYNEDYLDRYDLPSDASLEGYLFPETYFIPFNYDAKMIIKMMLDSFDSVVDDEMLRQIELSGYNLNEILTLASIVEKESSKESEKPRIAGVYYNRLRTGMKLQADPTLIYALTLAGQYFGDIRYRHFDFPSGYNTYYSYGLPPYPIANPGKTSIEATLYPEETDYFYFCASTNGFHVFSETYNEHLNNVNKYLR